MNVQTEESLTDKEQAMYVASQWQLMWRRLKRHKLAIVAGEVLILFYLIAIFVPFFSPYNPYEVYEDYLYAPPQMIHFFSEDGFSLRPFVYRVTITRDPKSLQKIYKVDKSQKDYIYFFTRNSEYKLWNVIPSNIRLFGVKEGGVIFLFGTDNSGRDLFSRTLYAFRISLSIGLIGVITTFILGCLMGGISGYYGGVIDMIIQRAIEFILSIPTIPLWMTLAAALPRQWSQIKLYLAITVILALRNWCMLARVVRGKLISTREEDFVMAAKIAGTSEIRIIIRHLLPSFLSYLIVNLTISIPAMIIGETALSFIGLGLRDPVISWGVLLNRAQSVRVVALYPWLMIPGIFVVLTVLSFNAVGDGLRDAADPYRSI